MTQTRRATRAAASAAPTRSQASGRRRRPTRPRQQPRRRRHGVHRPRRGRTGGGVRVCAPPRQPVDRLAAACPRAAARPGLGPQETLLCPVPLHPRVGSGSQGTQGEAKPRYRGVRWHCVPPPARSPPSSPLSRAYRCVCLFPVPRYGSGGASPLRKPRQGAKRGSVLKGSKKVGCSAYLTVTVLVLDPGHAIVRLFHMHTHATGGLATAADLWGRMVAPQLQEWLLRSFAVIRDIELIFRILSSRYCSALHLCVCHPLGSPLGALILCGGPISPQISHGSAAAAAQAAGRARTQSGPSDTHIHTHSHTHN
jgi:hypothetical protein